jgi:TolB-like protein/DNA-binding winged helix-turn-helix (wHTH) protein
MERQATTLLRIGTWCVDGKSGRISRNGETTRLEARTLRLLLYLADHAGEVVSIEDLLNHVWPGVVVTQDSVYQAVASLRRQLGDNPKHPEYIATVPRLGYQMVASVSPWDDEGRAVRGSARGPHRTRVPLSFGRFKVGLVLAGSSALCIALLTVQAHRQARTNSSSALATAAGPARNSIAVLPFLDLTEEMNQGPFADGITEELIDKLSRTPDLRVPSPTSSFYFKGKRMPIADIARAMGVSYLLDGSVRRSSGWVRVDARLVRADSGYVVWSETYDRPAESLLMIQDDIASEVVKALKASITVAPRAKPQ